MSREGRNVWLVALLPALLPALLCACASVTDPVTPPGPMSAVVPARAAAALPTTTPSTARPPDAAVAAAAPPATTGELLETTRRSARSTAEWLARSVDSWFGNRPFEQGGKVSDGRLSVGVFQRGNESPDVDVRFNARFRLPNIEHQAYIFVGRDDPRDVIQDTPDAFQSQQLQRRERPEDRSFLGGLGLTLLDSIDFRLGVSSRLKPYVQARYQKDWALSPGQQVELRETVFWTAADRFGSTTALAYELGLSPTLGLRWLNVATITQESRNFEWSSKLGAYQSFGWQRQLALEFIVSGTGTRGTGVGASDRGVLLRWEQPVYQDWLFGEIIGGHFWPRVDARSERGRTWAAGGSLNMRF